MAAMTDPMTDVVFRDRVETGEVIDLALFDGSWAAAFSDAIPGPVAELEAALVDALNLPPEDEIRDPSIEKQLAKSVSEHDLEEWLADPVAGPNGSVSIDGVAKVAYDSEDAEWRVDVADESELTVVA